jgi:hypothetical protein
MAIVFITKGKTNWKYIFIIAILAFIVAGESLFLLKQQVSMPETQLPEKITQDETANWKTCTNTGHKYEIKYPEDWILSEFCEGIPGEANFCDFKKAGFSSKETYDKISQKHASITNGIPNDDDINIWVVLKSSRQSLRDYVIYLATKIEHYNIDQVKIEEKKTNKGIDFLLYTNPTFTTHQTAFFEKDNTVYEIESHADAPNSETKSKVFNLMLSTFKFLE